MSVGQAKLITGGGAVAPPFSVFITPGTLSILLPSAGGSGSSATCTANVAGGVAPFTYLWTLQAGPGATVTPNDPTAASVFFTASGNSGPRNLIYKCTVTDSLAAEAFDFVNIDVEDLN